MGPVQGQQSRAVDDQCNHQTRSLEVNIKSMYRYKTENEDRHEASNPEKCTANDQERQGQK